MSTTLRWVLGAVLLGAFPSLASAQAAAPATSTAETTRPETTPAARSEPGRKGGHRLSVCRADIAKLCPDAKGGKRQACLRNNTSALSPECAAAFADIQAKAKAMREACKDDVKTLCESRKGAVKCLRANEAKLSPACGAAFQARYGKS